MALKAGSVPVTPNKIGPDGDPRAKESLRPADLSPPQALSQRAGRPQAHTASPHTPRRTLHPPPSPTPPHPSPPYRRRNSTRCSTSSSRQAPTLFDKSSTRARLPKKRLENSPRGSPPGPARAVPTTAILFASPL